MPERSLQPFDFFALPEPISYGILEQAVIGYSRQDALRLRRVCKYFDQTITRIAFGKERMDVNGIHRASTIQTISRYMFEKVRMRRSTVQFVQNFVNLTEKIMSELEQNTDKDRLRIAAVVCDTLAVEASIALNGDLASYDLLGQQYEWTAVPYSVAAALNIKDAISVLPKRKLDTKDSVFGHAVNAAAYQGNIDILKILDSKDANTIFVDDLIERCKQVAPLDRIAKTISEFLRPLTALALAAYRGKLDAMNFLLRHAFHYRGVGEIEKFSTRLHEHYNPQIPVEVVELNLHQSLLFHAASQAIRGGRLNTFKRFLDLWNIPFVERMLSIIEAERLAVEFESHEILSHLLARKDTVSKFLELNDSDRATRCEEMKDLCEQCRRVQLALAFALAKHKDDALELILAFPHHPHQQRRSVPYEHVFFSYDIKHISTLRLLHRHGLDYSRNPDALRRQLLTIVMNNTHTLLDWFLEHYILLSSQLKEPLYFAIRMKETSLAMRLFEAGVKWEYNGFTFGPGPVEKLALKSAIRGYERDGFLGRANAAAQRVATARAT